MSDINVEQGESSVQTDPVSSFSFDSLHEKALAEFEGNTPAEGAEQVPAPTPEATPEPAQNIDNASQAKLAQLNDTDIVKVTVDGQEVEMPWKDAKGGVMRQAHYTKSMQQLRQEQQQFETERTTLAKDRENLEVLRGLLKSEDLLKQFISKQYPSLLQAQKELAAAAAQTDPNDLATVGQIQEAQQNLLRQQELQQQQFLKTLEQREEALTRTIENRQATAKLMTEIDTTIKGLFSEHPHIAKLIPNANQVLRHEVLQLQTKTPEETLEAFKTVFGGWVENYNATVKETTKQNVIQKHKLQSNNIQPPGGAPPQPEPVSFKKVNKMTGKTEVDWDAVRAASLAQLEGK